MCKFRLCKKNIRINTEFLACTKLMQHIFVDKILCISNALYNNMYVLLVGEINQQTGECLDCNIPDPVKRSLCHFSTFLKCKHILFIRVAAYADNNLIKGTCRPFNYVNMTKRNRITRKGVNCF